MKNKKKTKPQTKIYRDEHEEKANQYFETFNKQNKKDPELLKKSSSEFRNSSNPKGKNIANFLDGLYFREKGIQEKNNGRACSYLKKSFFIFNSDKNTDKEAKIVMLEFYKRKIQDLHSKKEKPTKFSKIFKKRARIYQELAKEKEYHVEMSLYFLYASIESSNNLNQAIEKIKLGVKHAKKSGKELIIHKLEGILHKLKSHNTKTVAEAIKELEKEIKTIHMTFDKYGLDIAIGDLNLFKARVEREPIKKIVLLKEAVKFYEKANMEKKACQLRGDIYQIKGIMTKPQDEKHAEYYKKASVEYGKAGNKRMQNWAQGDYKLARGIKLGVLADDKKEVQKHLLAANHFYKNAGNVKGAQSTAIMALLFESMKPGYPKSIKLLKAKGQYLESIGNRFLSSFVMSEVSRKLTCKTKKKEERIRLMKEDKNYLERSLIEFDKKDSMQEINFSVRGVKISADILKSLSKARLHELNGFLEKDRDLSKKYFYRAKQEYLSLKSSGAFQTQVLSGIAWANLFLEDILGAKKYFSKLKKVKPKSPHIEKGMMAVDKLIKVKYSRETNDYLIKKRLSIPLFQHLLDDISLVRDDKPYPSIFFNLCLAVVKRSCDQLERFRADFVNSYEPSLRNNILMLSNSMAHDGLGTMLTGETFTCEGKSDILAVNPEDNKEYFIGECKIWSSASGYKKGFKQLVGRYLTTTDGIGVLINFVKKGNMQKAIEQAISSIKEMDKKAKIGKTDGKNFASTHDKYGIIFHLLVDLIPSEERTKH